MIKNFNDFIETRCEQALLANNEYREIQLKSNDAYKNNDMEKYSELSIRMLTITESVCYKLAIKDVYSLLSEN